MSIIRTFLLSSLMVAAEVRLVVIIRPTRATLARALVLFGEMSLGAATGSADQVRALGIPSQWHHYLKTETDRKSIWIPVHCSALAAINKVLKNTQWCSGFLCLHSH